MRISSAENFKHYPISGTKKGKVFKQKEKKQSDNPYALKDGVSAGDNLEPEVKQALENATDLELTDLAAVLGTRGFHNSRNIRKKLLVFKAALFT